MKKGDLAKSEYVRVTYQLKSLQAETFAPGVQKMMSPFGRVIPLEEPNQLILLENVGNLRIIIETITKIDGDDGGSPTMRWECKYCRAGFAAQKLKDLLGDPDKYMMTIESTQPGAPGGKGGKGAGGPGGQPNNPLGAFLALRSQRQQGRRFDQNREKRQAALHHLRRPHQYSVRQRAAEQGCRGPKVHAGH